jgi:hypothetical protein
LLVQRLAQPADRVLAASYLAVERADDKRATLGEINKTFDLLRLPRPSNTSHFIDGLRKRELVVRDPTTKSWSLTPEGRETVSDLVGSLDVASIEGEMLAGGGAELSHARHPVIPPELAPARWADAIRHLLDEFPFETNVFCMTRFPKDEAELEYPDPVRSVLGAAREVLAHHGLRLHLASERAADDELFGNIAGHMWACKYGIGLFETRFGTEFNDNLQIEVGAMLMTGRRVALLKDDGTPDMPTDFVGHIYKPVDFQDTLAVSGALHSWIADDLGLGRCGSCSTTATS